MFALDVLARFVVLDGLAKAGVLRPGTRVLSVLASTQWVPLPPLLSDLQAGDRATQPPPQPPRARHVPATYPPRTRHETAA